MTIRFRSSIVPPLAALFGLGVLLVGGSAPATPSPVGGLPDALKDYRAWTTLHDSPRLVPLMLSQLCVYPPAQSMLDDAKRTHGPHSNRYIQVYVNPTAAKGLARADRVFPAGSIVVKEKRQGDEPDGLGVMIKRDTPEYQASGGWEFLYYPAKGDPKKAHESCAACHRGGSAKGWLLGSYPVREIPPPGPTKPGS